MSKKMSRIFLVFLVFFAFATSFASAQSEASADLKSTLIAHLKQDDVSALEKLIGEQDEKKFPINGKNGASPLVLAAQHNAIKSLNWLLQQGAHIDALSERGSTALSIAAYFGHVDIIQTLALANANLGLKSPNGYQALDWALENQHIKAVEALVFAWGQREAKLDAEKQLLLAINANLLPAAALSKYRQGFSSFPLVLAIVKNQLALVEHLLQQGFDPNQRNPAGYAALPTAARLGNPAIVATLLAHKADPNIGGSKGDDVAGALNQATRGLQLDAAKLLIEAGAKVNKGNAIGIAPLYLCAVADTKDGKLTRLLLKHGADIAQKSDDGYNTLDVAMENRNRLYMRIAMRHLLEQSIANEQTRNALTRFLEGGAKSLPALSKESSALLLNLSILDGDAKLFALLMKRKVNPNIPNRSGHYPLSIAASWSETAMLSQLLKAKARVDEQNDNRYRTSALMESTREGKLAIARLLLAHGARINLLDIHQDHALNWAVFFGKAELVKFLLENKADPSQLGQQSNDNALDIAIRQGVPEVTELLRMAGAKASKTPD